MSGNSERRIVSIDFSQLHREAVDILRRLVSQEAAVLLQGEDENRFAEIVEKWPEG